VSLIAAIRAARTRFWAASGYFVPPHQERESLYDAARAKVDVRLILPSHSDVTDAVYAGRAAYGDLLESGVRVWEVEDAVLHTKLVVIDGVWTAIGSSNLDRRSVAFNNEIDVIILGRETAAQAEALLDDYTRGAGEVTLTAWRTRSLSERWREWKARVWQYWM
jgi:cardiolipin synthase